MARTTTTKKLLIAANVLLIIGLGATAGYFYNQNRELNDVLGLTTEQKNQRLIDEINEVFDLPDEEPVVAIVTNPDEFKSEYPAFDNAESGDYLLFFRKARLNVLYRQSEKRVVKTANVVVPITVELIGSESAIAAAETKLSEFGNQITVVKTLKDGIAQSFVFDVDDDQKAEAESIASQLEFEIGATLPSTITPTAQTEIVIAISNDELPASGAPSAQSQSTTPEQENTEAQIP